MLKQFLRPWHNLTLKTVA